MSQDIAQSLIGGAAVFAGLFVLWSFVGGIRHQPASARAKWALVAGVFSAAVNFAIRFYG